MAASWGWRMCCRAVLEVSQASQAAMGMHVTLKHHAIHRARQRTDGDRAALSLGQESKRRPQARRGSKGNEPGYASRWSWLRPKAEANEDKQAWLPEPINRQNF
ncbi:hypothetical protein DRO24_03810 [Candidatus Bathyarchaeota archaeon]|nr:MAG: hypothetical protein DRO24_03810 [Candidatus Bathyarchaeota archaeon]